jgi:hypothetical protein
MLCMPCENFTKGILSKAWVKVQGHITNCFSELFFSFPQNNQGDDRSQGHGTQDQDQFGYLGNRPKEKINRNIFCILRNNNGQQQKYDGPGYCFRFFKKCLHHKFLIQYLIQRISLTRDAACLGNECAELSF